MHDYTLPALSGRMFFKQPRPAATQLAEVGFLLRNGEFLPAARSRATPFPPPGPSPHGGHAGLYVDGRGRVEEIGNVWDQERILHERRRPRLRRTAAGRGVRLVVGGARPRRRAGPLRRRAGGRPVRPPATRPTSSLPASPALPEDRVIDGVHYHALDVKADGSPVEQARAFGRAAARRPGAICRLSTSITSTNG